MHYSDVLNNVHYCFEINFILVSIIQTANEISMRLGFRCLFVTLVYALALNHNETPEL